MNILYVVDALGRLQFTAIGGDVADVDPPPGGAVVDTPPPSSNHRWDGSTWVLDPDIPALKAAKRNELAAAWQAEIAAGVTLGTKTAPTDPASWTRYLALKAMAEDATTWVDVPIPLADGTFELLTRTKAAALWDALKAMERTLLVKLQTKVEAVQAATTIEEVEAITWE